MCVCLCVCVCVCVCVCSGGVLTEIKIVLLQMTNISTWV